MCVFLGLEDGKEGLCLTFIITRLISQEAKTILLASQ